MTAAPRFRVASQPGRWRSLKGGEFNPEDVAKAPIVGWGDEREDPFALETYGADEIFAPAAPVDWLLEDLDLCPGPPAMLGGYGFSGKTMLAQALAVSVAAGRQAWGLFKVRRGSVLHLDYEQGAIVTRRRYRQLCKGLGVEAGDLAGLAVATHPPFRLDEPSAEKWIMRNGEGRALVVVDSFRAAAPSADENSSDVRRSLDLLSRCAERQGFATVVVHHAKKPSKDSRAGASVSLRGSGAIFDACSSVLMLTRGRAAVRVDHVKARTSGMLQPPFHLCIAGSIDDADDGGAIAIRPRDAVASADGGKMSAATAAIADALARHGALSRSELQGQVRMSTGTISHAISALRERERIVNVGSQRSPKWLLADPERPTCGT